MDRLTGDLMAAITTDLQYIGERIYLDYKGKFAPIGSDEALECVERSMILKQKESILEESVMDSIKVAIESRLNEEDVE